MPWQSLPEVLTQRKVNRVLFQGERESSSQTWKGRRAGNKYGQNLQRCLSSSILEKRIMVCILPFQSHRSLCFYFCTFLHLELSFPRHSPGWLPCLPQAWPSLAILFKITAPSSLFPSHNLMFSISLITIGYHISTYLFITYLSLNEMLLPQQRNFYLFCLLLCYLQPDT